MLLVLPALYGGGPEILFHKHGLRRWVMERLFELRCLRAADMLGYTAESPLTNISLSSAPNCRPGPAAVSASESDSDIRDPITHDNTAGMKYAPFACTHTQSRAIVSSQVFDSILLSHRRSRAYRQQECINRRFNLERAPSPDRAAM